MGEETRTRTESIMRKMHESVLVNYSTLNADRMKYTKMNVGEKS